MTTAKNNFKNELKHAHQTTFLWYHLDFSYYILLVD